MKDLKELKAALKDVATQMRSLHDTIGDTEWSDEQRTQWADLKKKHDTVRSQIDREEEMRGIDQAFAENDEQHQERRQENREDGQTEDRSNLFDVFMRHGLSEMTPEQRNALREMRAQGVSTDEKGGYTVPTTMLNRVHEAMKDYGGIINLANVMPTATGNPIPWPTIDGTAIEGELLGENQAASEQDETFGSQDLGAKKISSKIIRISNELLQDSGIDMESLLSRRIAQRIGRTESRLLVDGTGAGTPQQPRGLAASTTQGAQTAAATAVKWKELNALIHSIDPAYRRSQSTALAFNDNTLKLVEELEDNQGRPLWLPAISGVAPSTVLGYRYQIDQGIADIAAGAKFAYFGAWEHFIVRRVAYMTLKRLVERYAEYDQTGFIAFHRFDCVLEDTAAIKALVGKTA